MSETEDYVPLSEDPAAVRLQRFVRALLVGAVATGSDLAVFTVCHRALGIVPDHARAPALFTGAIVQFLGNRWFTFRAGKGSLARHARLFFLFEAGAYLVNLFIYAKLVHWITAIPPELVTFLGTFLVFALYSYPVRRLVIFRLLAREAQTGGTG